MSTNSKRVNSNSVAAQDEAMTKAELEKNAKINAARMAEKAEQEAAAMGSGNKSLETQDEQSLDQFQARESLERLQPNARTAIFDDRIEYIHQDSSKLIDRGDTISVDSGRWSTPESEAALAVDAAIAKGWTSIKFPENTDLEFAEYASAFAQARGIEIQTENENQQETESEALATPEPQDAQIEAEEESISGSGFVPMAPVESAVNESHPEHEHQAEPEL